MGTTDARLTKVGTSDAKLTEKGRAQEPRIPKNTSASLVPAYEGAREVETTEQLDELSNDPDAMKMQALLVRERILGPAHPDTSYYIRYRGAVYADMGDFDRCISLWMYALDMQIQRLDGLSPMTQSSLLSFAELFSFMMIGSRTRVASLIKFNDIYSIFSKAIGELERGQQIINQPSPKERDMLNYSRVLVIIMHLMSLICRLKPRLTEEETFRFKKKAHELLKLNPRGPNGQRPLHFAVNPETTKVGKYPVCDFPCLNTVELLIELGAPVDAVDLNGNNALHIACQNKDVGMNIIQSLIRGGLHIDLVNECGLMPVDLLDPQRLKEYHHTVNPHQYTTLQCLAAKSIKKHRVKYYSVVGKELQSFVDKH